MICLSCGNQIADDHQGPCPNCRGNIPSNLITPRIIADRKREMDELEKENDIAGLREYAHRFAHNPAVADEANRRADLLDVKEPDFLCPGCDHLIRGSNNFMAHLVDEHRYRRANAEAVGRAAPASP